MIKDHKLYTRSDRTSCHRWEANQFRLFLHSGAYWLLHQLRQAAPRRSPWRKATFETIRRAFLKIAVRIEELKSRVRVALPSAYPAQSREEIMAANLQGTWNVLSAALEAGVSRLVFLSSVDVLGVFKGERTPDYLPLDDAHACYPTSPYGISKRLAEEMCRFVSHSSAVSVVCLRPPGVWTEETYAWIEAERSKRPEFEWDPYWEYGAFIDVRDLSQACIKALTCDVDRFACLLVSAPDITTSGSTSRRLVASVCPGVEWRGGDHYEEDEYLSLIDITNAQRLLSWVPEHAWRSYLERRTLHY